MPSYSGFSRDKQRASEERETEERELGGERAERLERDPDNS